MALTTDDVKVVLRITHDKLDDEIASAIQEAHLEMVRVGISAEADDELVDRAVKTYCQMIFTGSDKMRDGYRESWQYQLDNLRKSLEYRDV